MLWGQRPGLILCGRSFRMASKPKRRTPPRDSRTGRFKKVSKARRPRPSPSSQLVRQISAGTDIFGLGPR